MCREIPLGMQNYKCALTYSICKANMDLDNYHLVTIRLKNEQIELTSALLMDYGLIYQLIFSNSKQTDGFRRKLTTCVLNAFI